jgi:predicted dienelactone hydrolase
MAPRFFFLLSPWLRLQPVRAHRSISSAKTASISTTRSPPIDRESNGRSRTRFAGGVGASNFSDEALAVVTEPTILFVGTLDPNALENHNYAFERMPNAEPLFKVEVTGANHTHFANVCAIGDQLIDQLMITQDRWPDFGAEALVQPYNDTCTDEVFPIAEAHRLQNLYMVAHFKRYLLEQTGYDGFLSASYASENEPATTFVAK